MYSDDTFFHLTVAGQIGLAIVSAALAAATLLVFLKISSRFGLTVKIVLAIIFLWGFVWLSPQIYYFYYLALFDGLPLQNVVRKPPSPIEILSLITFSGDPNLSNHSKGLLFWLMVLASIWQTYRNRP